MNEREKLMERARIIQECWFAVCPYCKASADTGMTTMHTCVAKPLVKLHNDVLKQLSEMED